MSDPVSGIANSVMQNLQDTSKQHLQQQAGHGRSFESVLQQAGQPEAGAQATAPGLPTSVSGADLERMRVDLEQRIKTLPAGASPVNALIPELTDTRTRLSLMRDAMNSVGQSPRGTDLRSTFSRVEGEWFQLESIMKSNKDLSMPELLGLQARLYQVSQHVDVMSKVVDQVTGGIKTILNTNV